jgi:hypothetical protein
MPVRSIAALFLVALVLYGGWKAAPLLSGPTLSLTSPSEGQSFPGGVVTISGVARHTEKMTLNGAPLLIDSNGSFATTLDLPSGGAILAVTVTDRFGRDKTVRRSVYVP